MPSSVQKHYDSLLAEHYDWMFGASFEAKVLEQKALLSEIAVGAQGELAVDLGCGSGFQTLALYELGYRVLALDLSQKLLGKLAGRIGSRNITIKLSDLRKLDEYVAPASVGMIVCMGDTLTHLASRQEVCDLFRSVERALKSRGVFVVTYRDLSGDGLLGLDRFIPIRGDDERVMTCFLEYLDSYTAMITDLVHVRDTAGRWTLQKSSYQKLRLPVDWVRGQIAAAGLSVNLQRTERMATLAAIKAG